MWGVRNRAVTRQVDLLAAGREASTGVNRVSSGGARACTRTVASLTSKRSTRHPLSSADSGKSGASGDDRSGERSRDRSTDRSRERSGGSCKRGPRGSGGQDPMFVHIGHDADLPLGLLETPVPFQIPCASLIRGAEQRREPPSSVPVPRESPKKSRPVLSRFRPFRGLCLGDDHETPLSPRQLCGVPGCSEASERYRGAPVRRTPRSLLFRWTRGVRPSGSCSRWQRGGMVESYCGG
jgi:hypothetical protein